MSLSVCQEKSVCQKCQDFGNVRFWQHCWNASKGSIILFFCTMSSPFVLIIPGFPMITQFQQIESTR